MLNPVSALGTFDVTLGIMTARAWRIAACFVVLLGAANSNGPAFAQEEHERPALRVGEVLAGSPAWAEWSRRYLRPSGRVVDTGTNVSHSEGQGYGMLLAVAAGDRPAFDRIWGWTRDNLAVRTDNLLAWRWDPMARRTADNNNATDGDILVAWALAEAADLWNDADYATAGGRIATDIARFLIVDTAGAGSVLLPARFGFASSDQPDGPVVNLSYWIFPAFARLNQLAPDPAWARVADSGLAIVDALQAGKTDNVSNWTGLGDRQVAPARRFPAVRGYDAARIPLYLAFFPRDNADRLARFARMFPPGAKGLPIANLRTGDIEEMATGRGYRALAALRACAVAGQPMPRDFYWLGEHDAYYPATLHMFALVAALMTRADCMDPVEARHLQPRGPVLRFAGDLSRFGPVRVASQPLPAPAATPAAAHERVSPIEADNVGSHGLFNVAAPLGAALALAGFLAASRRSRTPAFLADPTPPVLRERSPAPRSLPENPFHAAGGERALEQRLDIAAKASWEWQRTAAVAYLRLPNYGDMVVADGVAAAHQMAANVVAKLAGCVRKSDHVTLLAQNEIVVCLSLIADEVDLYSVGRRLTAAVRSVDPGIGDEENIFGLALYPASDGSGALCLAEARGVFEALHPIRPVEAAVEKPAPAKRPAYAKTARRTKAKTKAEIST